MAVEATDPEPTVATIKGIAAGEFSEEDLADSVLERLAADQS